MCSNDLNQWTARTAAVHALFPTWSAEVRCLDLAEEAGELARAVLVAEGHKSADPEEPIAQALCGVLFDLLALAQHYQLDLDTHYAEQLEQLANRAGGTRARDRAASKGLLAVKFRATAKASGAATPTTAAQTRRVTLSGRHQPETFGSKVSANGALKWSR